MQDKDPNVFSFMMQLVQQKYGDEVDATFLNTEADKLYNSFGDVLVRYFEPLLTDDQKRQFDSLVQNNSGQDKILEFLMSSIENLDAKIQQVLVRFRDSYLNSPPQN
ncbi:hypothetical protein GF362_00140 [Candidatus Dojkabacteria bacterium]|nr:hypothetical protein [Candidatus Dojkabacteria bacterium]